MCARLINIGSNWFRIQILLARMSITSLLCFLYMWWADVPHAPFGMKEVRGILVVRGLGGFFGGWLSPSDWLNLSLTEYSVRHVL